MCPPTDSSPPSPPGNSNTPFPWHIGLFDAHCHATDTMSSIPLIHSMRARGLTIMATRSQDQALVAEVAAEHGVSNREALSAETEGKGKGKGKVVPAFGWHPWFSYQLYDDSLPEWASSAGPLTGEMKEKHYGSVLQPEPDKKFITALPDPIPLSQFISQTRGFVQYLQAAGKPVLIGEVGLDKAFRIPWPWGFHPPSQGQGSPSPNNEDDGKGEEGTMTPGGREGRMLSPYHVRMGHQQAVLRAQLRLAGELGVPVSVHGVQVHGVLHDVLAGLWKGFEKEVVSRRKMKMVAPGAEDYFSSSEDEDYDYSDDDGALGRKVKPKLEKNPKSYVPKPFPPRICLHSYSSSPQMLTQYIHPAVPAEVYFSFSTAINLSTAGGASKFPEVVRACPDDRILVESDLHVAGEEMDRALEDICRRVCEVKGWELEDGVRRLRGNWERFVFG
ncbi:endodeoxyribonuclease-like protein [Thermochaetoides thermophila DSM 1495]|uniref:Endodeoxyribonuclease-like protein n=1 Tax=Chaetomium thermophilum (strain DSM 1495 / CBS 144.50 / IMI 039719) TaxID=759272 RepID=G0S8I7_CHATD|nr:endodeoxyribonuclease-like protein [Thermochaetoides thermophila DSM 1495]EGS21161.1 endodeoxyribonuclease-like protein [Thermochaetoides thermophila DSM 1495]